MYKVVYYPVRRTKKEVFLGYLKSESPSEYVFVKRKGNVRNFLIVKRENVVSIEELENEQCRASRSL